MTNEPKYCCSFLKNLFANAGKKGVSTILVKKGNNIAVRLQFRLCDVDRERDVVELMQSFPRVSLVKMPSVALNWQTAIRHCPSCGSDLGKWIANNQGHAQGLVDRLGKLSLD